MEMSESINDLAAALVQAQAKIKGAVKESLNPHLKNKYADLSSVMDACKGPLNEHGISILQLNEPSDAKTIRVRTMLLHSSGQWISGTIVIPAPKEDPQGYGSAQTYARRYGLMAIVGVCPEDDDGEAAKSQPSQQSQGGRQQQQQPRQQQQGQQSSPGLDLGKVKAHFDAAHNFQDLDRALKSLGITPDHPQAQHVAGLYKTRKGQIETVGETFPGSAPGGQAYTDNNEPASPAQIKALQAHYNGIPRDERLAAVSMIVGREVTTFNALSKADAHAVLDSIKREAA